VATQRFRARFAEKRIKIKHEYILKKNEKRELVLLGTKEEYVTEIKLKQTS
jgi:hypothetical protein